MQVARKWHAVAGAVAASLTLTAAGVFAAGAPASRAHAAATRSCGNHSLTVEVESPGAAPEKFKVQTKNVKATGVSCRAAFKFVDAVYHSRTGTPEHFKCKLGKAKEPRGYFDEVCTKGSKKIEYGAQGG